MPVMTVTKKGKTLEMFISLLLMSLDLGSLNLELSCHHHVFILIWLVAVFSHTVAP